MVSYLFAFDEEIRARLFVKRLAHYLRDIAIYVDGKDVAVFDGSDRSQRDEIVRLARASAATRIQVGDPAVTIF